MSVQEKEMYGATSICCGDEGENNNDKFCQYKAATIIEKYLYLYRPDQITDLTRMALLS